MEYFLLQDNFTHLRMLYMVKIYKVSLDHVCVTVTVTSKQSVKAPLILGNPEENVFFEKGQCFALPKRFLCRPSLTQNKSMQLVP